MPLLKLEDADEIERMAELEHGRWNIERLAAGWRYAPGPKDPERKLNPCLIPWQQLSDGPEGVKQYDRRNITELPALLAQAGFVVVKAESPAA